jgi:hypothetical protein
MASRSPSLISRFNPANNSLPFHSFDTSCKRTNVVMSPHPFLNKKIQKNRWHQPAV